MFYFKNKKIFVNQYIEFFRTINTEIFYLFTEQNKNLLFCFIINNDREGYYTRRKNIPHK